MINMVIKTGLAIVVWRLKHLLRLYFDRMLQHCDSPLEQAYCMATLKYLVVLSHY